MAEGATSSLYGQFGRATYDHDGNQWHFERDVSTNSAFNVFGDAKVIVPPAVEQAASFATVEDTAGLSRRLEKQSKALIQSYPELQPASGLLRELARVSEAVEDAAQRHDPTKGDLLAFGFILDQLTKSSAEVVAFPSGLTGGDLRIAQVQKQKKGWDDSNEAWLELPTIFGEEVTWNGLGAPIQSITFAAPIEHGDVFLAVRLWTETLIFRPLLMRKARHGSSRLDMNLVFRLSIGETGDLPHAHVSFNLWSSRQLAIIDQAGDWSVRNVGGGKAWTANEVSHGSLIDDLNDAKRTPVDDGWASILWVGAPTILVVSNRHKLLLFDFDTQESHELQRVSTVLDDGLCWNLDLAVVPSQPNYLSVLTTAHVLIYYVGRDDLGHLSSKSVMCLRHFRNPGDISLRLHICSDDKDALMFIRSDLNSTIICYRLNFSDTDHLTMSDPTELAISSVSNTRTSTAAVSAMHVHLVPMVQIHDLRSSEPLTAYPAARDVRFHSITTVHKDLSVLETLCLTKPSGHSQHVVPPSHEESPSKEEKLPRRASQNEDSLEILNVQEIPQEPVSTYVQRRTVQASSRSGDDWTISYELTLRRLNDIRDPDITDIDDVLDEARNKLQIPDVSDGIPIQTLRELSEGELTSHDLQESMASLNDLQTTEAMQQMSRILTDDSEPAEKPERLVLRPIQWAPTLDMSFSEGSNRLSSLHQSIMDNWISPLSEDIPDIVRSTKEQHALRMATEVALASIVIRPEEFHEEQPLRSQSQGERLELPVRPFGVPRATPAPSAYFDASSQPQSSPLPTPSRSAAPSTVTSHSHPSTFAAPAIARLSRYTTFSMPPPPPLPRSLNRVLSHWVPGTDPAGYDWQATSRRFARQDEDDEGKQLSEKQRRREQRRAERSARRQTREAEKSERLQMLSSQAPEIVTESQPTQMTEGYDFNVSAGTRHMPASQILSGRHGGRQPAKKKRKSGF